MSDEILNSLLKEYSQKKITSRIKFRKTKTRTL